MTDRELLELAAKAAGVEGKYRAQYAGDKEYGGFWHSGVCWNPLTDDGDALRLAVKLKFDMCIDTTKENEPFTHVIGVLSEHTMIPFSEIEYHNNDPYAATRRAIVRAAAEIGRGMK